MAIPLVLLHTVLRSMAQLSDGLVDFEEAERRGIKVYSLRVNWDPTQGMGMNPFDMFTPTFSFKDGYAVAKDTRVGPPKHLQWDGPTQPWLRWATSISPEGWTILGGCPSTERSPW